MGGRVAEDESIRAAVKKFAEANEKNVAASSIVTLPNGLAHVVLDPTLDGPNRIKRDAWLKSHYNDSPSGP